MANRKNLNRSAMFEVVESRCLMAGDLMAGDLQPAGEVVATTNATGAVYLKVNATNQASDLNLDGVINHRDAHAVVSFLNARAAQNSPTANAEGEGSSVASASVVDSTSDFDSNGDGQVSPMDVLWIVNQIKEYDPLTPCDCAACSQPTIEGRCENASLAQAQSNALLNNITLAPEGEPLAVVSQSQFATPPIEELLRVRRL